MTFKLAMYYAVCNGRVPGIYSTWEETTAQVSGFSGAIYRRFESLADAQRFLSQGCAREPRERDVQFSDGGWAVYTDGSSNGRRGGYGIFISTVDRTRKVAGPLPEGSQTAQRAELYAVYRALQLIPEGVKAIIYSDSQFVVGSVNVHIHNWRMRERDRRREHFTLIDETEKLLTRKEAQLLWIRGHTGDPGNEEADRLAGEGREYEEEKST